MALITEFVNVSAVLQTAVAPRTSFGIGLFLVDDSQIPIDQRYKYVTPSDWDDLTSGTDPYSFSNVYFGQKRQAQKLMLGRWVSSASEPYFVCGTHETDYAVWELVSDGSFTVSDGTSTDVVTGVDFDGITALSQVATVLTAAIQAIGSPNITGLDTATFEFDSEDRLILKHSATGASAATLSIVSGGGGTDLTSSTYMDVSNGFSQAGLDAEEPTEALTAISELDDSYYEVMCERSLTTTQQVAVGSYVNAKKKQCILVYSNTDAKSAGTSTDLGSQCADLALSRTMCVYSEHSDEWPDAAIAGCVLPASEGTTEFAMEVLALVQESGLAADGTSKPLTTTEISVLEGKKYNRIAKVGDNIFNTDGMNANGTEHRIMLGKDWFEARIQEDVFTILLQNPLSAFDNPTLAQFEAVVREYATEAINRGILVDTPDRPFVIDFPDADDFSQSERASHDMVLSDVFSGYLNSAAVTVTITGTWTI